MIARRHRFHGYGALRYVYQNGQTVRNQHLAIKYVVNHKRTSYRTAVVVSKKVAKSAVLRNRIRRRVFEVLRRNLPPDLGHDLVVSVFSDQLADLDANKLNQEITSLLKLAGLA